MASNEIHKNDIGTIFDIQLVTQDGTDYDFTGASLIEFIFQKPDGTTMIKTGVTYENNIRYVTIEGDIDQIGLWKYQIHVEKNGNENYSNISTFKVHPNLIGG